MWRRKRRWNTEIGRKIADPTRNNAHQFQGQKVKVKVTRSINVEIKIMLYLTKGKAYELQTSYTDGTRRPVSLSSGDLQGLRSISVQCIMLCGPTDRLAHMSKTKSPRNIKISTKFAYLSGNNVH